MLPIVRVKLGIYILISIKTATAINKDSSKLYNPSYRLQYLAIYNQINTLRGIKNRIIERNLYVFSQKPLDINFSMPSEINTYSQLFTKSSRMTLFTDKYFFLLT